MNEIFKKQLDLQNLIALNTGRVERPINRGQLVDYIKDQAFYLNSEILELMEAVGGSRDILKPWKASYGYYAYRDDFREEVSKSEAIDMLCFAMNICLAVGVTPDNIDEEYDKVWQKNIKRQQDGY